MAQRNVYKSQLPGFRASDIQLSFANYRAQADVAGEIIKRIDTVSDFALKKVNEQKVYKVWCRKCTNIKTSFRDRRRGQKRIIQRRQNYI